jgi:hypothetical protein
MLGRGDKNNTKITSIMAEDASMLTNDKEKAKNWVKDTMSWKEIYKASPVNYLEIIANGENPVWDKKLEKFVAKGEETVKKETTTTSVKYKAPVVEDESEDDDEMPF